MPIPAASDTTESLADWLEVEALRSSERRVSLESLVRLIRRTGTTDAVAGPRGDKGSEESQRVAQDTFSELGNREIACGPGLGYPFEIEQGLIRLKNGGETSLYVLLLMLSLNPPTAGHNGTASLFEDICRYAAHGYLGGEENRVTSIRFGSPRKAPFAKFNSAIEALCLHVAEGGGCRSPDKANHLGDDGLDIVAWRNFPDLKEGKLIAFGQCACGSGDWADKLAEMDGTKFVKKWFRYPLVVDPVRLFFLPRRISRDHWENTGIDGGILFDRCRIVACARNLDSNLVDRCKASARLLLKRSKRR